MGKYLLIFGLTIIFLSGCASTTQKPTYVLSSLPQTPVKVTYEVKPQPSCFRISAVGDIMLGGSTASLLEKQGYDYPFKNVGFLAEADITMGNLETALTHGGEEFEKKYNFRNPPEKVAPALKNAGFDLVSLANNHTMDYGEEGLVDTLKALDGVGIAYVGAGNNLSEARNAHITSVAGVTVATLGYSLTFPEEFWAAESKPGTAFGRENHIREDVKKAAVNGADFIVVQFHWGREGTTELRDYQVNLAKAAIDSGADLIIGHHPHVVQAVEKYGKGVIYYSLGNFAFGSYSNRVETGGVANVEVCDNKIAKAGLQLVAVNNFKVNMQPKLLEQEDLITWYEKLKNISKKQQTKLMLQDEEIVVAFNEKT